MIRQNVGRDFSTLHTHTHSSVWVFVVEYSIYLSLSVCLCSSPTFRVRFRLKNFLFSWIHARKKRTQKHAGLRHVCRCCVVGVRLFVGCNFYSILLHRFSTTNPYSMRQSVSRARSSFHCIFSLHPHTANTRVRPLTLTMMMRRVEEDARGVFFCNSLLICTRFALEIIGLDESQRANRNKNETVHTYNTYIAIYSFTNKYINIFATDCTYKKPI